MEKIRAAVVGVGYLGRFHAQKYALLGDCSLVGVVDVQPETAARVAAEVHTSAYPDFRALLGKVDAVSVVTPTPTHYDIARAFLESGAHVLVEKPIAESTDQAERLIGAARQYGRVLQVGHLERFNPTILAAESLLSRPRFIECHRLAPFTERGTDVDVVLDLMVHDLDVLMSLTGADATSVEALGVAVLTDQIDVANARIRFSNGMIANMNTSRVAPRRERKIRFFQPDAYISVDYEARRIQIYRKSPAPAGSTFPVISAEQIDFGEADPLADEVASFIASVRDRSTPAVTARDGLRVIELIERIRLCMEQP